MKITVRWRKIKISFFEETLTLKEIEQSINNFWIDIENCISKADAEGSALGKTIETLDESIENGNVSSTIQNRWEGSTTYIEEPGELAIKASESKMLYEKKKKELETAKQNFGGIKQSISLEQIQNYVKQEKGMLHSEI